MARDEQGVGTEYQPVVEERKDQTPYSCDSRADDSGIWNTCKAWYLVLAHLAACLILLVCIELVVDKHDFETGSPPWVFKLPRYQIQVTGIISFSLVLIRMLGGACSTLLVWRTIFVLLNRQGVTLVELVRLINYRVPMFPRGGSKGRQLWLSWAALVIILLWPSGFASPAATSAVAWIPATKLSSNCIEIPTKVADGHTNYWDLLLYSDQRSMTVASAASMAGINSTYAFNSQRMPLRRYFPAHTNITASSVVDITVPYFDVDLHWIDGADDIRFQHVGDSHYSDIVSFDVNTRIDGLVRILRNETWDPDKAMPRAAEVFSGGKVISVKVNTLDFSVPLPDGSTAHKDTPCPQTSSSLGKLPNVTQKDINYFAGNTTQWLGKDCFLVAEASITAGKYKGTDCTVNPAGNGIYAATCTMQTSRDEVEADWLSSLSIEFMSEVMRYVVMLNTTSPWMYDHLDNYTTGMLHLAHHAAWSSLTNGEGKANESASVKLARPVIRAQVDEDLFLPKGMKVVLSILRD